MDGTLVKIVPIVTTKEEIMLLECPVFKYGSLNAEKVCM